MNNFKLKTRLTNTQLIDLKYMLDKDMRKISNIVENLIKSYVNE